MTRKPIAELISERVSVLMSEAEATFSHVGFGLVAFARGFWLILQSRALIVRCLYHTPAIVLCVCLQAGLVRLCFMPLSFYHLVAMPSWDLLLKASGALSLGVLRVFVPKLSGKPFFAVLSARDDKLAGSLEARPVIYGWAQQVRQLILVVALGIPLVVGVVSLIPLVAPAVLAGAGVMLAAILAIGPIGLVIAGLVIAVLALGGWGYVLISPLIMVWRRIDPLVALIAAVAVLAGALHIASIGYALRTAAVLYWASTYMAQELLSQYSIREERAKWSAFKEKHRWRLLGFGLPIWVLVYFGNPLVAASFLDTLVGVAGSLFADLLGVDGTVVEEKDEEKKGT
eukprot:gnl/TRDRNA2_/TRDRNA2_154035_c0_seq2.p1 gnl/TRDRNA2_/TRDRNA2_154035_c0~~gnl/TRDRNA2_/TRDRNA2_154035_c0_seq2.p1  ORF type:complete len:343 (+),score=46.78 gnl/TRDRNA2_/TRDRNA2_154035_c0_seq2:146-1174(+)